MAKQETISRQWVVGAAQVLRKTMQVDDAIGMLEALLNVPDGSQTMKMALKAVTIELLFQHQAGQ